MNEGLFIKFDALFEETKEAQNAVICTERLVEEEIDKVKDKFRPIIDDRRDFLQKKEKELYDYSCLMVKYSNFNKNDLGKILSLLISVVEGRTATGQDFTYREEFTTLCRKRYNYAIKIAPRNLINYETKTQQLIDGKVAFVYFDDDDGSKDSLYYYRIEKKEQKESLDVNNYVLTSGGDLKFQEYFSYVYKFINYMIQYKIENNLLEIDYKTMVKLMKEYLPKITELIEDKHRKIDELELEELKEKQTERRRILNKFLSK